MNFLGEVKITFIANAGLLIEYDGQKLLIDGMYDTKDRQNTSFSNVPQTVQAAILSGESPFDSIDWLMFTHEHSDHFVPSKVQEYLQCQKVKGVILPPDSGTQRDLRRCLKEKDIPLVSLKAMGKSRQIVLNDSVTVMVYDTRHLGKCYQETPHFSYLFSFKDKKILITADVDYTYETFHELAEISLRAIFVNPLFFDALCRERFFKGRIQSEVFCVYHIPFPEDDVINCHGTLQKSADRWREKRREQAHLLVYSGQQIVL